jgi:hypothetical protein
MSDARTDCDAGSVNPPADSDLVTGNPNIAQATITSAAAAMIRLGAAIAANAMRRRMPPAVGSAMRAGPSAMSGSGRFYPGLFVVLYGVADRGGVAVGSRCRIGGGSSPPHFTSDDGGGGNGG